MLRKLNNNKGEFGAITAVMLVDVAFGHYMHVAHDWGSKEETVDTVQNPAPAQYTRGVQNF